MIFFTFLILVSISNYELYDKFRNAHIKEIQKQWQLLVFSSYFSSVIVVAFALYFKRIYEENYHRSFNSKYITVVTACTCILFLTVAISATDSVDVLTYSTYGTYIEIGAKKIASNENYYYIGRTKNFIFFYNSKNNQTDVFQNKDITKLSINNNSFEENNNNELVELKKDIDSLKQLYKSNDVVKKHKIDSLLTQYKTQHNIK